MASRYASCVARKAWNCSQLVCSFSLAVIICFIEQVYNISQRMSISASVNSPTQPKPQLKTRHSSPGVNAEDSWLGVLRGVIGGFSSFLSSVFLIRNFILFQNIELHSSHHPGLISHFFSFSASPTAIISNLFPYQGMLLFSK